MSSYRISKGISQIEVKQTAFFPVFMGLMACVAGTIILFLTLKEGNKNGWDFWGPLSFASMFFCVGIYLVSASPFLKSTIFHADSNQLKFVSHYLFRGRHEKNVEGMGIDTLSIRRTESDGFWYTPTIKIADGGDLEVGFGCGSTTEAESLITQLTREYANLREGSG